MQKLLVKTVAEEMHVETDTIRIAFANVRVFMEENKAPIRVLITGADAGGKERRIKTCIEKACKAFFAEQKLQWHGFENPALAGQR